jgi:hypothetical protein
MSKKYQPGCAEFINAVRAVLRLEPIPSSGKRHGVRRLRKPEGGPGLPIHEGWHRTPY